MSADAAVILELDNVTKRYDSPSSDAAPLEVLTGLSYRFHAGESVAIVGPSGCGKSTLLNLIGALDRPTAGRVLFDGHDLGRMSDDARADLRNNRIGFIFQSHHLLPQLTAVENVLIPTLVNPRLKGRQDVADRAHKLLSRVGLAERTDRQPMYLSGGERQRVAVVRALINEPAVLLADEPTGSLDRASAHELAELLRELNNDLGVTLITVTHSADLAHQMHHTLELRNGTLHESGTGPAS